MAGPELWLGHEEQKGEFEEMLMEDWQNLAGNKGKKRT